MKGNEMTYLNSLRVSLMTSLYAFKSIFHELPMQSDVSISKFYKLQELFVFNADILRGHNTLDLSSSFA